MTARAKKAKLDRRAAARAFDQAVGARIQERRKAATLSQAELGDKVGCSFSQISRYESGENPCENYTLTLIAGALGCKASDFVDGIKVGQ